MVKLVLFCPECGCTTWKKPEFDPSWDGCFLCKWCGTMTHPEEMGVEAEEVKSNG